MRQNKGDFHAIQREAGKASEVNEEQVKQKSLFPTHICLLEQDPPILCLTWDRLPRSDQPKAIDSCRGFVPWHGGRKLGHTGICASNYGQGFGFWPIFVFWFEK